MKYALVFLLSGLCCAYFATTTQSLVFQLLAGCCAVAFTGVGLAYAFVGPRAFLKQPGGQLSPLSYLIYWPYHLLNWLTLLAFRRSGKEDAFDQIDENVYLGCRLNHSDKTAIKAIGIQSVLDLTCEFSEIPFLRQRSYRCIPVLDTSAPTLESLEEGALWIEQEAAKSPVYVHCALGHGRSAMFVAAYLMMSGQARTPQEAIARIQALRPRIGLHRQQIELLEKLSLEKPPHDVSSAVDNVSP